MKPEIVIILFFLVVGLIAAWFHWYFVGSHRIKLVNDSNQTKISHSESPFYIDDIRMFEILPNGDMEEIDLESYCDINGWSSPG